MSDSIEKILERWETLADDLLARADLLDNPDVIKSITAYAGIYKAHAYEIRSALPSKEEASMLAWVDLRLEQGWSWSTGIIHGKKYASLIPPKSHPRRGACAKWNFFSDDGKIKRRIPHWIMEGGEEGLPEKEE